MTRLRLSQSARADLFEIRRYGVEHFGAAADPYFRRFREVFSLLRSHPLSGAAQDDLGEGVRCFVHRRHRIFYRVTDSEVRVLRIIHHAKDIPPATLEGE